MNRVFSCGSVLSLALVLSAHGQTRVQPMCHAWVTQEAADPASPDFVPMVVVWNYTNRPEFNGWLCLNSGFTAGRDAAYTPRDASWINNDGSNVMILIPHIGHEYHEVGFPCYGWPTGDARAFFRPDADSLAGYVENAANGKAYYHPFLVNATTNTRSSTRSSRTGRTSAHGRTPGSGSGRATTSRTSRCGASRSRPSTRRNCTS